MHRLVSRVLKSLIQSLSRCFFTQWLAPSLAIACADLAQELLGEYDVQLQLTEYVPLRVKRNTQPQ